MFKYEHCGYTYSHRVPHKDINAIYKKTYVKDYGHLWLENLKACSKQGFSLRKMSNLLGGASLETIRRYVNSFKLDEENNIKGNKITIKSKQEPFERITIVLLQKYIGYYNLQQKQK